MKKFFAVAAVILGVVVSQIVVPSQAEAQEVYLGEDSKGLHCYLLTETVHVENKGSGQFGGDHIVCTVRHGQNHFSYDFLIWDNDTVMVFGDNRFSGGTVHPSSPPYGYEDGMVAHNAFLVIMKMFG